MAMQPAEGGLCEYHSLERNGTCHHGERKINNMHEPTRRSWWRSTPALRQRPLLGALRLQAVSAALRQRQRYGGALPLQPAAVVDEQAGDPATSARSATGTTPAVPRQTTAACTASPTCPPTNTSCSVVVLALHDAAAPHAARWLNS
jgi:hypothetical protein